jgi:hypothetical protein
MMTQHSNPFVAYLNRYTTVSPEHEAAFDEFISQDGSSSGMTLQLQTRTEQFVRECFQRPLPPSIIVTGNAGDGKTYLCRQIIESFTGQPVTTWSDRGDWPIQRDNLTLRVVKDLSELGEDAGAQMLREMDAELARAQPQTIFLLAANEGRLRALLSREGLHDLYTPVDRQIRMGTDAQNSRLIVIDLNQVTTSTYVPQAVGWLTAPAHWHACQECPARDACPIRFNAQRLADTHIGSRLTLLYQTLEHLGLHITIRDMLIHLAYTTTGGLDCHEVIEQSDQMHWDRRDLVYYENVWGTGANTTFRQKAVTISQLRRLQVGEISVFAVDDFIINGSTDDTVQQDHDHLFQPALDLNGPQFDQDRRAYLHGGAASPQPADQHPLMHWLVHCRRKLFFEWRNTTDANHLFAFRYLPDYFTLLTADRATLKHYGRELVLGLNRAFSGLYLTDPDYLYVTSQYAHAVEQPVPIIRTKIATDYIELTPEAPTPVVSDYDLRTLVLEIPPPPRTQTEPIRWKVDLLRFEYLMWRARGGMPTILARECELAIRQLKDDILLHFAAQDDDPTRITFFAAERTRYAERSLWVDDQGTLRT